MKKKKEIEIKHPWDVFEQWLEEEEEREDDEAQIRYYFEEKEFGTS